jgi:hypothetical protein
MMAAIAAAQCLRQAGFVIMQKPPVTHPAALSSPNLGDSGEPANSKPIHTVMTSG